MRCTGGQRWGSGPWRCGGSGVRRARRSCRGLGGAGAAEPVVGVGVGLAAGAARGFVVAAVALVTGPGAAVGVRVAERGVDEVLGGEAVEAAGAGDLADGLAAVPGRERGLRG